MASGHGTAQTGRTHGCTDQACDVKILLANLEPSTHGTSLQFTPTLQFGRNRSHNGHAAKPVAHRGDAHDPQQSYAAEAFRSAHLPQCSISLAAFFCFDG